MTLTRSILGLFALLVLTACGGGMQLGGGPAPTSTEGEMLAVDPAAPGQAEDTPGTPIPGN
jgi:hypothetical protein